MFVMSSRAAAAAAAALVCVCAPAGAAQSSESWINDVPANARHIRFVVKEGTRISIDVSPDGKTLVFDLLGDLYQLDRTGGRATRLTSGRAIDVEPRFSPDGKTIAFISDRNGRDEIWLLDRASGTLRRASDNPKHRYLSSPTWSPDGRGMVVGVREMHEFGNAPLLRFNIAATGSQRDTGVFITPKPPKSTFSDSTGRAYVIVPKGHAFPSSPTFARDGKLFFEFGLRNGNMYIAPGGRAAIARLDPATGDTATIIPSLAGSALRPVVSPDGHWLAYATRTDTTTVLMLHDLTSSRQDRLLVASYDHDVEDMSDALTALPGSTFTPDSRAIIASHHGKLWSIDVATGAQHEIPFSAEVDQAVLPLVTKPVSMVETKGVVTHVSDVAFSPNGKSIAFVALDQVYVMPFPGGTPRRLTHSTMLEISPTWSPDGREIAYTVVDTSKAAGNLGTDAEGYVGAVYVARADGSGSPRRISQGVGFYDRPAFTSDGQVVVRRSARRWWLPRRAGAGPLSESLGQLETIQLRDGRATPIGKLRGLTRSGTTAAALGKPYVAGEPTRIYFLDADSARLSGISEHWLLESMAGDGSDRRPELDVLLGNSDFADSPTHIAVSPDGRRAAVLAADRVYVLSLGGSTRPALHLDHGHPTDTAGVTELPDPADEIGWTPDSRSVYFVTGRTLFVRDVAAGRQALHEIRVPLPVDRPNGTIVLHNARLITMRAGARDSIIERGDVVIVRDRITAVGRVGEITIPRDAHVIDATGKTILPGFVGLHEHYLLPAAERVHLNAWGQMPGALAYGMTTLRDPSTRVGGNEYAMRDLAIAGRYLTPRIFSTGAVVGARLVERSPADARFFTRRNLLHESMTMKEYDGHTRAEYRWTGDAAREAGIRLTAHVGSGGYRMTLGHVIDGYSGHEHELPPWLREDMVRLIAETGITVTSTLQFGGGECYGTRRYTTTWSAEDEARRSRFIAPWLSRLALPGCDTVLAHYTLGGADRLWPRPEAAKDIGIGFDERNVGQYVPNIAQIARAGGRVGMGSHDQIPGLGYHFEIWAMASSGGMTPYEALRSATIIGAEALGQGADFGSIAVGKLADLIVLAKNPLEDITNTLSVRQVILNGRVYDSATLDEIWPRQRSFQMPNWNAWNAAEQP